MKYIVVLGDGMADYPVKELGGKTPLQAAKKPNIDLLARNAEVGLVRTIPDGVPTGSETANLSVLGYDPQKYYKGRSPLEAVSMGVELSETDASFRCNLVTLSVDEPYGNKTVIDHSSDEISTAEAVELIKEIDRHFHTDVISFHPGISYRHCMVWKGGPVEFKLTPPHDILERKAADYLPKGEHSGLLLDMMVQSYQILKDHPVNTARRAKGLRPANSIWLWGEGRKPAIPRFQDKYNVRGSVISAVDLIKGIGICSGMRSIDVEGATGNIHTDFKGKADAALRELGSGQDFVYVHVEAPDECGHRNETENKVKAIELIDELVVGTILKGMQKYEDYRLLILPDHPTPLSLRTHTRDAVPYLIYQKSRKKGSGAEGYDEAQAAATGIFISEGYTLMDRFIGPTSL